MIIKCYEEKHKYLLFIDVEFNGGDLVQFTGLLWIRIDDGVYQLMRSCNQYVATKVCYPFMEYTNITNTFLSENGIPLADVQRLVLDDFLGDIDLSDMQIISHGLRNDRLILARNGINLQMVNGDPIDGYCTFNNARRLLNRRSHLTLVELAQECGYYLHNAHNAFNDVWASVSVYTFLRKIEHMQKEEERMANH